MNIQANTVYKDQRTGRMVRALEVRPDDNLAILVNLGCLSARPVPLDLSEINNWLTTGRLLPATIVVDESPEADRSKKAIAKGEKLKAAFAPLVELGAVELSKRPLWREFRRIGLELGMTPHGVNAAFTRVLQAGMRLGAAVPKWNKSGRTTVEVSGDQIKFRPTNQPDSYPLTSRDLTNIRAGALKHLKRGVLWYDAHDEFLREYYPARVEIRDGMEKNIPKEPKQRPSLQQFKRHAIRSLGQRKILIMRYGEAVVDAKFSGKPIGQAAVAGQAVGMEAEIDWTTTGLVTVRCGNRLSIGSLVVYVIADRFSGMIMAVYLTLGEACYNEAARAVLMCLEDKVELCKRYGLSISPADWNVRHLMIKLTADRGEINSWKSTALCTELGIKTKFTRTRKGKDKGTVESMNALIKRNLRKLSGGIWKYRNGEERQQPQVEAVFDFDQVYRILLALALRYNKRLRRRQPITEGMLLAGINRTPTPDAVWNHFATRGAIRQMELEHARIHVLPSRTTALTEQGIVLDGLRYMVPDFQWNGSNQEVRNPCRHVTDINANDWLSAAKINRWKVGLSVDPATVNHVWLRYAAPGTATRLLKCELAPGQTGYVGMTWHEYLKEFAKENTSKKNYEEFPLREARHDYRKIVEETTREATALTEAARAGMSKSAQSKNLRENLEHERNSDAAPLTNENVPPAEKPFAPHISKFTRQNA